MRYWFIAYRSRWISESGPGEWQYVNDAIDIHPTEWLVYNGHKTYNRDNRYDLGFEQLIQFYHEISKDEYDLVKNQYNQ